MSLAGLPLAASASNPLSAAEQQVCRSLSHCLSIVDAHPADSFDYGVLAAEFRRFGETGRDALLQKIEKGGTLALHAADLLALSRDASAIAPLSAMERTGDKATQTLAGKTRQALTLRLQPAKESGVTPPPVQTVLSAPCPHSEIVAVDAQRREMPFFESDVARPDAHGAYRPSARFTLPLAHAGRGALRSAVPVPGGWLAGYAGGLVRYDAQSGEPTLLSDARVISLQRRDPERTGAGVWAVLEAPGGMIVADALALTVKGRLPGRLSGMSRTANGTLLIGTDAGTVLGLSPQGDVASGCGPHA